MPTEADIFRKPPPRPAVTDPTLSTGNGNAVAQGGGGHITRPSVIPSEYVSPAEKHLRDAERAALTAIGTKLLFIVKLPAYLTYPTPVREREMALPELKVEPVPSQRPSPVNIPDIAEEFFGDIGKAFRPVNPNDAAEKRFRESNPTSVEPSPSAGQGIRRILTLPIRTPVRLGFRLLDDLTGGTDVKATQFTLFRLLSERAFEDIFGLSDPPAPEDSPGGASGFLIGIADQASTGLRPTTLGRPRSGIQDRRATDVGVDP